MVLGLTRPRTRLAGTGTGPLDRSRPVVGGHREWHTERGEILFEASCDVFGGFPGYAAAGGRLAGQRLRVTERYLLAGDGDELGFGLAIRDIEGVALVPLPDGDEAGLRLFYHDGASPRVFTVRFHGNRLSMRSGPRAERAHLSLLRAGLVDRFGIAPPPEPNFVVSWDDTADFDAENVVWTGCATVPRYIGLEGAPGNVWLTTRSLIWGCDSIRGVHRVPLAVLTDVAVASVADRAGTPALYVGLGDESTGHFDLAFLFDQQSTPDHNLRDRGALLVGLRSRGVPIGSPAPPFQPWRQIAHPVAGDTDAVTYLEPGQDGRGSDPWGEDRPVRGVLSRRRLGTFEVGDVDTSYAVWPGGEAPPALWADAGTSAGNETVPETAPCLLDVVLAEWSAPPDDSDRRQDDVQVAASWLSPLPLGDDEPPRDPDLEVEADVPIAEAVPLLLPATTGDEVPEKNADLVVAGVEPQVRAPASSTRQTEGRDSAVCWPRAAAYEAAAVAALAEILAAIRDRADGRMTPVATSLPTAAEQSVSLAELAALGDSGAIAPDEVRGRSARLLALGDACVRLRTLVELRDAGHVSDADLARRQQAITAQLAAVMEVR